MWRRIWVASITSVLVACFLFVSVTFSARLVQPLSARAGLVYSRMPSVAASPTLTPTLSVYVQYVVAVYRDLLGRNPSPTELSTWRDYLNAGNPRIQLPATILASNEYFSLLVTQWYPLYLHRPADPGGLSGWVSAMHSGATDEQVIAALVGSTEYYTHSGGINTNWVNAVYADLLNRPPTSPNTDAMLTCLTGDTRVNCALTLLLTRPEYRALLLNTLYQKYLRRPPSGTELANWQTQLAGGATDEQVSESLVSSDEYFNRFAYFYQFLPLIAR